MESRRGVGVERRLRMGAMGAAWCVRWVAVCRVLHPHGLSAPARMPAAAACLPHVRMARRPLPPRPPLLLLPWPHLHAHADVSHIHNHHHHDQLAQPVCVWHTRREGCGVWGEGVSRPCKTGVSTTRLEYDCMTCRHPVIVYGLKWRNIARCQALIRHAGPGAA